jgi:ribulose-bisphosphate carboxylase large chain
MEKSALFTLTYRVQAESEYDAEQIAHNIRTEQTVEMPLAAVPDSAQHSIAELLSINTTDKKGEWKVTLSFPHSVIDGDITQLINVLFGNISLLPGIKIIDGDDQLFSNTNQGPAFGIAGIRSLLDRKTGAISCTALKPIGLTENELAERAYSFSKAGIDIVKDDHGLTNQSSATFKSRISACVDAIRKGEQHSGKKTLYFPNITSNPVHVEQKFHEAVEMGADGVLLCPQLTGLETLSSLAKHQAVPIMAHPAFSGSYVIHEDHGFTPEFYYGKLWRALGADCIIYPNAGGRFGYSTDTCIALNRQMHAGFCDFKTSLPSPAGGINLNSIPELLKRYGSDIAYLVGGSLYNHKEGIEAATIEFLRLLEGNNGESV